jgi:cobalt-zinc-cadmium efflux system outer membrane protein
VGFLYRWIRVGLSCVALAAGCGSAAAGEALDVERYVEIVLRSHPSAAQASGLQAAAEAEQTVARLFPDPVFEYSRGTGRSTDGTGSSARETGYSLSQTIPWPGTFSAGIRAGDRAADGLRAGADAVRWELEVAAREAFARLEGSRSMLDIARAAEEDARSLRDLVARRAELGESRESDRIKAAVEWLRQQRNLTAAERGAGAIETIVRTLAVETLPHPLEIKVTTHPPLPALDRDAIAARLVERNPRARAARAEAERQNALLSAARRGRMPDLGLTLFQENEIDREGDGVLLGIRLPLWNANRGDIARARSAAEVSGAEAGSVRISLAAELEGRLRDLQIAGEQARLLDSELLPAATRSVELARFSYEEGETSLLDLLDAQRTYRDTQREAIEAHLSLALALTEVQRLVGPDFNPWR